MTITLPDELRAEVEAKAKAAGFADVGHYLTSLVLADDRDGEPDVPADYPGPPGISYRTVEERDRLLDEGMDSGPGVIADAAFWAAMKERVRARGLRKGETG